MHTSARMNTLMHIHKQDLTCAHYTLADVKQMHNHVCVYVYNTHEQNYLATIGSEPNFSDIRKFLTV